MFSHAMYKYFITISTTLLLFFVLTGSVFAQTSTCQPIYGGGQSCVQSSDVSVNKEVKNPLTNDYVHNLSITDPKYVAGQTVPFKITVKNNTNNPVSNIQIKDIFAQFVDFSSGASGSFDPKTHTYSFTIDKLNKNEAKVYFLVGKVYAAEKLPPAQPITCVLNQTVATANSKTSQDNSQFCIAKDAVAALPAQPIAPNLTPNPATTKGGLPIYPPAQSKTTPPTGPESWAVFGLLPTGALGFWLRRKTKIG